jgi:predicted nucleic acid-binding protein
VLTLDANVWVAAFDPHDRFHDVSVTFLRGVAEAGIQLHAPAFAALETACALSRRTDDAGVGVFALERLRAHPLLVLHPLDERCLHTAESLGVRARLRAGDALYAATAALLEAPLVSWDTELVERAAALTPEAWLGQQPA